MRFINYITMYKSTYIIPDDLPTKKTKKPHPPGVTFSLLGKNQLDYFDLLAKDMEGKVINHRLKRNDVCILAHNDKELFSYVWMNFFGMKRIGELKLPISIGEGESYVYDADIATAWKENKVFITRILLFNLSEMYRYLKSRNIKKILVYTSTKNKFIQHYLKNMGYKHCQLLRYIKLFKFNIFKSLKNLN